MPQSGGAFLPGEPTTFGSNVAVTGNLAVTGTSTFTGATTLASSTLTSPAITTPTITDPTLTLSGAGSFIDRVIATDVVTITGAALHAANLTLWTAPAAAIILRVMLNVTTVATAACTVDIGYTATTATTSSDTLLDGVDVNAATALFDSGNAALDSGANAKAQLAASGKWITADEASGDATGLVAVAYIQYMLV